MPCASMSRWRSLLVLRGSFLLITIKSLSILGVVFGFLPHRPTRVGDRLPVCACCLIKHATVLFPIPHSNAISLHVLLVKLAKIIIFARVLGVTSVFVYF